MKKMVWGKTADGAEVHLYTLASGNLEVRIANYGAHLVSVHAPDRSGRVQDVVLGFSDLAGYLQKPNGYLGAVVGRYGNRIGKGQFSIDGNSYTVPANDGPNALHGGPVGFDRYVWTAAENGEALELTHVSPDGDMGFPGTMTAKVRYSLEGNTLRLDYTATTDKPTVLNLTNHAYFNLHGDDEGTILDHVLELNAGQYTPVDAGQIPTGEIAPVAGTPLDFRKPEVVGACIEDAFEQLKLGRGYDHNFVLNGAEGTLRRAAKMTDKGSGRTLTVETTEPAIQFYSGNFLDGKLTGRHGKKYEKRTGFCLETQHYPDAPNHANFPSAVLRPGATYRSTTTFTFGVE